MNFIENNTSKMNEVIFENRNKNYGAYQIRTHYDETLLKSILLLVLILSSLFIGIGYYNRLNAIVDIPELIDIGTPDVEILDFHPIDVTPLVEKPQPINPASQAAAAPNTGISTNFNNNAVITSTQAANTTNLNIGLGTSTATGTSVTSTLTSTPNFSVEAPPSNTVGLNTEVFIAEEMPEFEGGIKGLMQHIGNNIHYPDVAKAIGKEGTVHISFVVNEVGTVEGVKIMRGIGYGCDEEVVRVISKLPTWKKVGKNNGRPVKVRFNIPVRFTLQ